MASKSKKILMFDDTTGMLSREVMLAYLHGELSPSLRADVDNFLATDEMHRDILEGLRQISDKVLTEKAAYAINEKVAKRSGAVLSDGSITVDLTALFGDYMKIAALAGGALLIAGIIFTVMMLNDTSSSSIAINNNEENPLSSSAAMKASEVSTEQKAVPAIADDTFKRHEDTSVFEAAPAASENVLPSAADQTIKEQSGGAGVRANKIKPAAPVSAAKADTAFTGSGKTASAGQPLTDVGGAERLAADEKPKSEPAPKVPALSEGKQMAGESSSAAEEMPQFPGGEEALRKYFRDNLKYPEKSKEFRIKGNVRVSFTVGASGRVKDIRVLEGINKEINAEAIRLISNMPAWKPGKQKGKPAPMKQHLTIEFSLD